MANVRIPQERRDIDFESSRKPVERRERRHCLTVLYLGNISAWYAHPSRKLTLGEIPHQAQITDRSCYLQAILLFRLWRDKGECRLLRFGQFQLETLVATPAHGVGGAELHQAAMVATEDLPLFD
jgi:hypothetical protein